MKNVLIFSFLLVVMIMSLNNQSASADSSLKPLAPQSKAAKQSKAKAKKKSQEITETKIAMTKEYKQILEVDNMTPEIYEESVAKNVSLDYQSAK